MDPSGAVETFWIPPIWTPEWGFHWDMVANYAIAFFLFGGPSKRMVDGFFDWLRVRVNSIKFKVTIPVIGVVDVDMDRWTWDDELIEWSRERIAGLVLSRQNEAERIKVQYKPKIEAEEDPVLKAELVDAYSKELKDLTGETVRDFKVFFPDAWEAILKGLRTPEVSDQWVEGEVKAIVSSTNGHGPKVSMAETLLKNGEA